MSNKNHIAVVDFETSSPEPNTCDAVQLACIMIDTNKLEIIKNSEFCIDIQPPSINDKDYYARNLKTIEWHAGNYECTAKDIYTKWQNAVPEKMAMTTFSDYLLKYHTRRSNKGKWSAPIMAGHNIYRFDLPIMERLCKAHGHIDKKNDMKLFFPRTKIDTIHCCHMWFEDIEDITSYSMDFLRPYMAMPKNGIEHDAMTDVIDTSGLLIKFLQLHRRYSHKVGFKDAFKKKK